MITLYKLENGYVYQKEVSVILDVEEINGWYLLKPNGWDEANTLNESKEIRTKRNNLLRQSDFAMLPDSPVLNKTEWETYRQALRDITEQDGFPKDIIWPTKPE